MAAIAAILLAAIIISPVLASVVAVTIVILVFALVFVLILRNSRQRAEQAMEVAAGEKIGCEIESIDGAGGGAVAKAQSPETFAHEGNGLAIGVLQQSAEMPVFGVKGRNISVAEHADQEVPLELPKLLGSQRHAPG